MSDWFSKLGAEQQKAILEEKEKHSQGINREADSQLQERADALEAKASELDAINDRAASGYKVRDMTDAQKTAETETTRDPNNLTFQMHQAARQPQPEMEKDDDRD